MPNTTTVAVAYYLERLVEYEQNIDVVPGNLRAKVTLALADLGFKLGTDGYIDWITTDKGEQHNA
jgi:hypothetical protein